MIMQGDPTSDNPRLMPESIGGFLGAKTAGRFE
jgi:hypothetical protein